MGRATIFLTHPLCCSGFCSEFRAHTGARPSVRLCEGTEQALRVR
jgi:hypothetical protein